MQNKQKFMTLAIISGFVIFITIINVSSKRSIWLKQKDKRYDCDTTYLIVDRLKWDTKHSFTKSRIYEYEKPLTNILKKIIIHHSAFPSTTGPTKLLNYQLSKGFADIAYHFIISPEGKIYEGRYLKYMGANAGETMEANELADSIRKGLINNRSIVEALKKDPDYGAIGICLQGNFQIDGQKPTKCQLKSLNNLLTRLIRRYKINPKDVCLHKDIHGKMLAKGLTPADLPTVCPGKNAYKELNDLINDVAKQF